MIFLILFLAFICVYVEEKTLHTYCRFLSALQIKGRDQAQKLSCWLSQIFHSSVSWLQHWWLVEESRDSDVQKDFFLHFLLPCSGYYWLRNLVNSMLPPAHLSCTVSWRTEIHKWQHFLHFKPKRLHLALGVTVPSSHSGIIHVFVVLSPISLLTWNLQG